MPALIPPRFPGDDGVEKIDACPNTPRFPGDDGVEKIDACPNTSLPRNA